MSVGTETTNCFCFNQQTISVTRLGEKLPLWQKCKSLCLFFQGLFGIWQNCERTGAIFYAIGQILFVVNDQIMKNNPAIWSHC